VNSSENLSGHAQSSGFVDLFRARSLPPIFFFRARSLPPIFQLFFFLRALPILPPGRQGLATMLDPSDAH